MERTRFQIQVTREAGTVRRCHLVPIHGSYNIAQHTYGAVSLLLLLNPRPSVDLIKAVMWHDVGERWLGDMPSPAKLINPQLRQVYEDAERRVVASLGLLPGLMPDEQDWLLAVDILDLWLWAREEVALGNIAVQQMIDNCDRHIQDLNYQHEFPELAYDFFWAERTRPVKRLSDFFEEAILDGLGEAEG